MIELKSLRVYRIINPPNNPTYCRVNSIKEAVKKINELARKDLRFSFVETNIFGLEEFDFTEEVIGVKPKQEWVEWYDEGGFDIQQVMNGESDYYDENGKKK